MTSSHQVFFIAVLFGCSSFGYAADNAIDFGRDVRPLLAKHCFTCHGPDENAREADLRLDQEASSHEDRGGYRVIDPGEPDSSELIVRITSSDPDLRMPPSDSHSALSSGEIETLREWIASGGKHELHWAFVPAKKPTLPVVGDPSWCRGPIDRFVLSRMERAGLEPAQRAGRETLLRRVYLDVLGTAPTFEEAAEFLSDDSPRAYESLVDRLLSNPACGERFARPWLDLARYSDTNGYEKDRNRTIWPYRDWVINALNADQPFDEFSIEQIAGDMLPEATQSQRIATGFHRNTMLNEEGGIDPLEYRFYAMVDRVATTGTVWMGLTTGCAQCHTHKYDPITHTDYYSLLALMDNADEPELAADPPSTVSRRERILTQIDVLENDAAQRLIRGQYPLEIQNEFSTWTKSQIDQTIGWTTVPPSSHRSTLPRLIVQEDGSVLASGDATKRDVYTLEMPSTATPEPITAIRIEAMPHPSLPATGPGLAFYEGRRGDFFLSEVKVIVNGKEQTLDVGSTTVPGSKPGNGKVYPGNVLDGDGSTGWSVPGGSGQAHRLVVPFKEPIVIDSDWSVEMLFERHYVAALGHFRIDVTAAKTPEANLLPSDLQTVLSAITNANSVSDLPPEVAKRLATEFFVRSESTKGARKPLDALRRQLPAGVRTLVMRERPSDNPRITRLHHRGEYLQPKETVSGRVPEVFLANASNGNRPADRLELANWLVSEDNPLVGRVTANRIWRHFFGTGIVRTAGDFGTQSEPPTHPKLLDWLDQSLRDSSDSGMRWSTKKLLREILLSSTYQQASGLAPQQDPDNRLLSVFPYRRLDAEQIRDTMLSASGLLSRTIGGPSVYPPQPETVFKMAYGKPSWPTSKGADRYRRSLYTFSKRTAPFAAFSTFDAPSGELCIARRDRSTTPLQALTLLNDEMYLEIADGLAKSAVDDASNPDKPAAAREIASNIFQRILVRKPNKTELDDILQFYDSQRNHSNPWMLVARAIMNLDEAITTP